MICLGGDLTVWFITGASRGLGAEIARQALECGDSVSVTARDVRGVMARFEQYGSRVPMSELDVTKEEEVDRAVAATLDRFGRIDVLMNNAGRGLIGAVEEADAKEYWPPLTPMSSGCSPLRAEYSRSCAGSARGAFSTSAQSVASRKLPDGEFTEQPSSRSRASVRPCTVSSRHSESTSSSSSPGVSGPISSTDGHCNELHGQSTIMPTPPGGSETMWAAQSQPGERSDQGRGRDHHGRNHSEASDAYPTRRRRRQRCRPQASTCHRRTSPVARPLGVYLPRITSHGSIERWWHGHELQRGRGAHAKVGPAGSPPEMGSPAGPRSPHALSALDAADVVVPEPGQVHQEPRAIRPG